jgi:hypothetical protein
MESMIVVARSAVARAASLSARARLVLGFIRNGRSWFDWTASAPQVRHEFPDESAMLDAIQLGLHATPLLRMPRLGLLVSPVKLMTAQPPDLEVLAAAERGEGAALEQARSVLAAHHLLTDADLARTDVFLERVGLADSPIFLTTSLSDRVALFDLACAADDGDAKIAPLYQEAATFAATQAETPRELADYVKLYLALAAKPALADAGPEKRAALADHAIEALRSCLYGALECPQIGGLAGPAEIARVMRAWIGRGRQIAFARLSAGARQIVEHTRWDPLAAEGAKQLVPAYLREAQSFLAVTEPKGGVLGQDGVTCLLTLESDTRRADIEVGAAGQITLRAFRLQSPARPAPSARAVAQRSARP